MNEDVIENIACSLENLDMTLQKISHTLYLIRQDKINEIDTEKEKRIFESMEHEANIEYEVRKKLEN